MPFPRRPRLAAVLGAVAALALLAGCEAPGPAPTPTPTVTVAPSGDGVLRIGTLFTQTGSQAAVGAAQLAGVFAAIREIGTAGGALGAPVELVNRDIGDGDAAAVAAVFAALVEQGVDVVIGPSSSMLAPGLREAAAAAGVLLVAPAPATASDAEPEPDADLLARLRLEDPGLGDGRFAADAYDAVVLAALAAAVAGDDGGPSIGWRLPQVLGQGVECTSYGACLAVLGDGQEISYRGVAGPLHLEGDPLDGATRLVRGEAKPSPTPSRTG